MLTNPNTLGLFDENIDEIAAIVHGVGGTLYYDGANLNAIGVDEAASMGFDIVHLNLHKSFSQPHGGGGPGPARSQSRSGSPRSCRCRGSFGARAPTARGRATRSSMTTRGRLRLRGFQGFGVFVRTYAYIASLGGDGLREASETAVLNANYLLARLARARGPVPAAGLRAPLHARVRALRRSAKRDLDVKTLDVAKRLLDYGFHPPTIYFPLLVDEALMVEPTETETRESLDARRGPQWDPRRGRARSADPARGALHDAGPAPRRGGGVTAPWSSASRSLSAGPRRLRQAPGLIDASQAAACSTPRRRSRGVAVRATSRNGPRCAARNCSARARSSPTRSAVCRNGSAIACPGSISTAARSSPPVSATSIRPAGTCSSRAGRAGPGRRGRPPSLRGSPAAGPGCPQVYDVYLWM